MLDTKKIERRLETAAAERELVMVQQDARVGKAGEYLPVTTGKSVYLAKGKRARLRRGQIAFVLVQS